MINEKRPKRASAGAGAGTGTAINRIPPADRLRLAGESGVTSATLRYAFAGRSYALTCAAIQAAAERLGIRIPKLRPREGAKGAA
jgi:hypothetical protein